jgi:3-oxoacyl-[acyl-carrier protein] reductase
MNSSEQVVLVTGGATGIGKAISQAFAKQGYQLVVHYNSSEQAAAQLIEEIKQLGGKAVSIKADISKYSECERLIKETLEAFGRIDVLVNNAGVTDDGLILRMSEAQFDRVIATDLKAVWALSKHVARPMLRQGSGRIINISSVSGLLGNAGQSNYSAAKAGVIGLTKSLAREFASKQITVNAIAPGFIDTDMTKKLADVIIETAIKAIPLGRMGTCQDVAAATIFLASEQASYITGVTLCVDGGLSMY